MFLKRNNAGFMKLLLKIFFMIIVMGIPSASTLAAGLKVTYDGKSVTFAGQQATVQLDGKSIDMKKMPGLVLNDYTMIACDTVFKSGLGAACTYDSKTGNIQVKKNDIVIKMKLGSKTATVNSKTVTMPAAPKKVKYAATGLTKIMVPAQFVATKLGYTYSWQNNSKTSLTVKLTSPLQLYYDNALHTYTATKGKATVEGKSINVSDMPVIILNNTALLQAKAVFSNSSIGADYVYNSSNKTVTLTKDNNTVILTLGSKYAMVNDETKTLDTAARMVKNATTGKSYVMVPGRFVANALGYHYTWNSTSKVSAITKLPITKSSCTYFNLGQGEGTVTDGNTTNITNISAGYDANQKGDFITFTGSGPLAPVVTDNGTSLTLEFQSTGNGVGNQQQTLAADAYMQAFTIQDGGNNNVIVTITKSADVTYMVSENENLTTIFLKKQEKKRIKIAIDCGHGAYTAGKRTPKMPVDVDFDGDGVIDVYKGQTIKEHTANVGVGQYLAAELERCGFEVYRSAFGDTDVPLAERQANIKAAGCDYSISVHFNAMGDGVNFNEYKGLEVFYHNKSANAGAGLALANALKSELLQGTPQIDRGVKSASLAMCNTSQTGTLASVLVECAFMTNEYEAIHMMANAEFWKETAQDIARGVCNYTGQTYIPE